MLRIACVSLVSVLAAGQALSQGLTRPKDVLITAHVVVTAPLPVTDERIAGLKPPPGFHIAKWAEGLDTPRVIAVAPNGDLYASSLQKGTLTLLRGTDKATARKTVREKKNLQGLAIHDGQMFYTTDHAIFAAPIKPDGSLGDERLVADHMPDVGQHNDRTIAFGPDGWLYASIGSTCNECAEQNPESATVIRMKPDGGGREIFASGLRNTIGFGFRPGTTQLYGWDDGVDWLGDDAQPEEFNKIEQGKKYGWPYVLGDGQLNYYRDPPKEKGTLEQWDKDSVRPALTYTAHASGMQMVFCDPLRFPADFKGDALVTLHGSWNREPPSGYEIVRVHFVNDKPATITPFLQGFLSQTGPKTWTRFARPFGLAVAKDGSLLMARTRTASSTASPTLGDKTRGRRR